MTPTTLHIPVLYGSQTGNSQSCAESFAKSLPRQVQQQLTKSNTKIKISSSAQQLDDFLEMDRAEWPSSTLVIIICSSYGVGQAPLGCWKFRELCDDILSKNDDDDAMMGMLNGINYALLGLGDSKYTTFFLNPTAIDSALSKAGATRIGKLGKADASGKGEQTQLTVMDAWCEEIISDVTLLVKEVASKITIGDDDNDDGVKEVQDMLLKAQEKTCNLCKEVFDDWEETEKAALEEQKKRKISDINGIIFVGGVAVSILTAMYLTNN